MAPTLATALGKFGTRRSALAAARWVRPRTVSGQRAPAAGARPGVIKGAPASADVGARRTAVLLAFPKLTLASCLR